VGEYERLQAQKEAILKKRREQIALALGLWQKEPRVNETVLMDRAEIIMDIAEGRHRTFPVPEGEPK
jgi:hypothetical protein